jgi:hypothetical protein
LAELRSIALVVADLGAIPPPPRDSKRCYPLLVKWFVANWAAIAPWIGAIRLCDSGGQPINRAREMVDRGIF